MYKERLATEAWPKRKHPDFVIVGAPKAGTTSLYKYLAEHPRIFFPKIKEPMFFCGYQRNFKGPTAKWYNDHIIDDPHQYLTLFENLPENVIAGEASTDYLSCPEAPTNIKAWNPNVKIIIVLRNPIDRAYSEHMNLLKKMCEKAEFLEAVHLEDERIKKGYTPYFWHIKRGLYYEAVKRYLEVFDRKNILILFYDDLSHSSKKVVQSIFSFLGLNEINIDTSERFNVSGRPKSIFLQRFLLSGKKGIVGNIAGTLIRNPEVRAKLRRSIMLSNLEKTKLNRQEFMYMRDIFSKDIIQLQNLLQVDLSDWLKDRCFD
jgi:hypothetical protein